MNHSIYLKDPGIYKNNTFFYTINNKKVSDPITLTRLHKLRVPPAWNSVWYSSNIKSHVQVHGVDQSGKKQYILSEAWTKKSRYKKYIRMKSFMNDLVQFKKRIKLHGTDPNYENVVRLLFNLLLDTHIRVGNEKYVDSNGSYGLTTLRQKHFVNNSFVFTGKSGINHTVVVPKEYLPFLQRLKLSDRNKCLFLYNELGKMKTIDSEELNGYLKKYMGKEYTCKDFRTYSANMLFIKAFLKNVKNGKNIKKVILQSIDESARELGHSRSISRKSYISDTLINYCLDSFDSTSGESTNSLLSRI